jgi:hypothetical protein
MMPSSADRTRKVHLLKKRVFWVLELGKWILVLYLLWPMRHASNRPVGLVRVVAGIALFVIFSGKLFYDIVISDFIRQKRTSPGKDLLTLLGSIVVISCVVGLLLFFVGWMFVALFQTSTNRGEP